MGGGGAPPGRGPSALQHHNRLAGRPLQRRQEAAAVPDALYVGPYHRGLRVPGEVVQEVRLAQVQAVAVAHRFREAQAAGPAQVGQLEQQVPALRQEPDVPRLPRHVRSERYPLPGVEEPHAVGADDTHAGGAGPLGQPPLQLCALLAARLGEAGGEQLKGSRSLGRAVVHQLQHRRGGDTGDDVVHLAG